MLPSREEIFEKARALPPSVAAIEAYWDGDTTGWIVILCALIEREDGTHADHEIAFLRGDGGDIRLFNEAVPPWPEARLAAEVGAEVAALLGVPFWFPSPDRPEDDCPRYLERALGAPCAKCGLLLLQKDPCPWKGVCYECHLARAKSTER